MLEKLIGAGVMNLIKVRSTESLLIRSLGVQQLMNELRKGRLKGLLNTSIFAMRFSGSSTSSRAHQQ